MKFGTREQTFGGTTTVVPTPTQLPQHDLRPDSPARESGPKVRSPVPDCLTLPKIITVYHSFITTFNDSETCTAPIKVKSPKIILLLSD